MVSVDKDYLPARLQRINWRLHIVYAFHLHEGSSSKVLLTQEQQLFSPTYAMQRLVSAIELREYQYMQSVKIVGMRIGTSSLAAHVCSVVESCVYLLKTRLERAAPAVGPVVEVEFFDRLVDLQAHIRERRSGFCIYLRGFEPFARADYADAVIDRPIRPMVLEATLNRLRHHSDAPNKTVKGAGSETMTLSPDQMLHWLHRSSGSDAVNIGSGSVNWWCSPSLAELRGTSLDAACRLAPPAPTQFTVETGASAAPLPTMPVVPFDQWIFLIARHSSGAQLLDHEEHRAFKISRSVLNASDNRDFARLSAIFLRPHSVQHAAQLSRTTVTTVRQFLNANIVLGRVTLVEQPAPRPQTV
jgi:hypothetical protein